MAYDLRLFNFSQSANCQLIQPMLSKVWSLSFFIYGKKVLTETSFTGYFWSVPYYSLGKDKKMAPAPLTALQI